MPQIASRLTWTAIGRDPAIVHAQRGRLGYRFPVTFQEERVGDFPVDARRRAGPDPGPREGDVAHRRRVLGGRDFRHGPAHRAWALRFHFDLRREPAKRGGVAPEGYAATGR